MMLYIKQLKPDTQTDTQRNKLMHVENTLVMYGIYNAETLEKLVKTVHALHSRQSLYESLFAGQTSAIYEAYSQMHGACGIQHYTVNLMLYLHTIKDSYIEIYNEFIFNCTYMVRPLEFCLFH